MNHPAWPESNSTTSDIFPRCGHGLAQFLQGFIITLLGTFMPIDLSAIPQNHVSSDKDRPIPYEVCCCPAESTCIIASNHRSQDRLVCQRSKVVQ